nr:hypothetical protein [Tanacetum cinerariifolium]
AFQALPPPDYLPGLEEPEQAPPSPVYIPYVPEPVYPEYIPPEDDVFPAEEQPLPIAASPTAESTGYIPESDPNEDPEEDGDEEPEEDPADYPADHDDKEEEEPSRDDAGKSSVAAAARSIEGHRAHYRFVDFVEAEIRRWRAEDIGYGIRDTWIDLRDVAEEEALMTLEGVNTREARCSREAWAHSIRLSSIAHFELQGYMTHTWVQDQRIDAQDTLIATLTTQLSLLQGYLATALGEIRALQAREQARAGAPEGASSST